MKQFARVSVRFAILAAALLAAACTQTVRSEVSRFHTLGIAPNQQTVAIAPRGEQVGSPEFRYYADAVMQRLVGAGYTPAANPDAADIIGFIDYTVGDGQTIFTSTPVYGSLGYGFGDPFYDPFYRGRGRRGSSSYGVIGTQTQADVIYQRTFKLELNDQITPGKLGDKVFEGKAVSNGTSSSFARVGLCLIDSLFANFPGGTGRTEVVAVNAETCLR
jgi:hypothetical protein